MKKLLISFFAVGALLTSCASFDEPTALTFGEGPSIEISSPAAVDDAISFTVTPGPGTNYYTFAVVVGDAPKEVDGTALLKDQVPSIASETRKASEVQSVSYKLTDLTPNTSYVVYAVAGDANGSAGKVASVVIKTPDTSNPMFSIADAKKGESSYTLPFAEFITQGAGSVTAKYFVEWEGEFVDVPEEDLAVTVDGNNVTFDVANVPGNCYVLISFEEGAFIDEVGNKCAGVESGFNDAMTGFTGCYFQTPAVPFEVTPENVVSPEPGRIMDWEEPITLTFEENVYEVEDPEAKIIVTYVSKTRTVTYTVSEWAISEDQKSVTFNLPEAPAENDKISIAIGEGIVTDVYGNPNAEVAFENLYIYETARWINLGIGQYTDAFIAPLFGEEALTYDVEILEKEDEPGLYRVMNPYSNSVYPFADDDCAEDGLFIEIDATDPDGVLLNQQSLGFDWGYGVFNIISVGSYYMQYGRVSKDELKEDGYLGTLKDGVISFPVPEDEGFGGLVIMGGKAYPVDEDGSFQIVLPNAEAAARSMAKASTKHSKVSKSLDTSKAIRFSK